MIIEIKVAENGFIIDVRGSGYAEGILYVAESERSLLDTISVVWRKYKNEEAEKGGQENG